MGICINCEGVMYTCGYTRWENFREEIANASIRYLQNEYETILLNGANESYLERELSELMEYIDINNCKTINDFTRLFSIANSLNLFIYYNMSGVFALLHKSDDDGYYTVGNAVDILQTFSLVEDYIVDTNVKEMFAQVKKVFDTSVQKQKLVSIY
jgi:hypothetical protein